MNRILAGALLAVLVAATAPAYAQTNAETLRDTNKVVKSIDGSLENLTRSINAVLGDIREAIESLADLEPLIEGLGTALEGITGDIAGISDRMDTLERDSAANTESLSKIESALLGESCGPGTSLVGGVCLADIVSCDALLENGVCMASITCGEGTLLHVDTCVADASVSFCGEGTTFQDGKCVAVTPVKPVEPVAPVDPVEPAEPEPEPEPETPQIIQPDDSNRYVLDGGTIRIGSGDETVIYTLAFTDAPGLTDAGGRAAVQYLDGLCGSGSITAMPESAPTGLPKAIVTCAGIDASQAMILAGHASFDAGDCGIRDFILVDWTLEMCALNEPEPEPGTEPEPEPEPTEPTEPTTTPEPSEPAPTPVTYPEPIRGTLGFQDYSFPVTVGDVMRWPKADDGDPHTVLTVGCSYPHTPVSIDAVVPLNDDVNHVYEIDKAADQSYTDNNRRDTTIRLTEPLDRTMFSQKFAITSTTFAVYDQKVDTVRAGNTQTYKIAVSLADWDDAGSGSGHNAAWNDQINTPAVPIDAEKKQKIFDVQLQILTDITNMQCILGGTYAPPPDGKAFSKLLSMTAKQPASALMYLEPYDVECSEAVTITGVSASGAVNFLSGFNTMHITDNDEDADDGTLVVTVDRDATPLTGLSFISSNFTVGATDRGVDALGSNEDVSPSGVALVSIAYTASSEDTCQWTKRTG